MSRPRWDLLVLGGGTAGIVGAKTAASLGASVLMVERERPGGDCLWTGCVPSKALLSAAHAAADARRAADRGVLVGDVTVDFARVRAHVQGAIEHIAPVDSPAALVAAGVQVRAGTVRLTGPGRAEVDGEPVDFAQALLALGAAPSVPGIPGMADLRPGADGDYVTSETIWDLTELPEHLVVLGGGTIGCELGQGFARLGSRVTIVEGEQRILGREDPAAAAALARMLIADGVELRTGAQVTRVDRHSVQLSDGETVPFSRLLVAAGRTPRTADVGLAEAGVEVDDRGHVLTDELLRTTNPRIWAAGDLTVHPQFTHTAASHGSLAASNAVLGVRRSIDLSAIPRVTYTQPEIASVGEPTDAVPPGRRVLERAHDHLDRAVAEGQTDGFARLVVDRRGRLLGATIVGPRAGETLGEVVLAVSRGLSTRDLAGLIHAYPTYNEGLWSLAASDVQDQLRKPATARALATLTAARRWWVERDR